MMSETLAAVWKNPEHWAEFLWRWANDSELSYWLTWIGIWTSLAVLSITAAYMWALKPRQTLDVGYTWLITAMTLVLIRVVVVDYFGGELGRVFWGSLTWFNLSLASVYTLLALMRQTMPYVLPSVKLRPAKGVYVPEDMSGKIVGTAANVAEVKENVAEVKENVAEVKTDVKAVKQKVAD